MAANKCEKGSLSAIHRPPQASPVSSSERPPADTAWRYCAIAASSSVMKYVPVESGKLGIYQKLATATRILTAPGNTINHCYAETKVCLNTNLRGVGTIAMP